MTNQPKRYVTKSGKVLTDADLQRLADEAEAGYCTAIVDADDDRARCFKSMPCPEHGGPDAQRVRPEVGE